MSDTTELKRLQEINRIILNEVVRVCEKYKITYYLDCGALLGAVRHKSFIPWDDDIDISFTRNNYLLFEKAVKNEWKDSDFLLNKPDDFRDDKWLDNIIRIVYLGETVATKIYNKIGKFAAGNVYGKPSIDVFILDCIPDNRIKHLLLCGNLIIDYALLMGHRLYIDYSEYSFFQRILIWNFSKMGKLFRVKKLIYIYNRHCTKYYSCKGSYYFYSNFSLSDISKRNKREWYGDGSNVTIDGILYNAPFNYHEVLKMNYGDYMKLPPDKERVAKHL